MSVWPPESWCAEVNPQRTHLCDRPRGHKGDHSGPEMPTIDLDEPSDLPTSDGAGETRGGR